MPICKNDPKRTYKGTEPSPKGLGYCAHSEKLDKVRKGKDGNNWIISQTKSGTKRWIKFKKEIPKKENKKIDGKHYFIHENNKRPFVVFINKNKVDIYKKTKKENYDENPDVNDYTKLVKSFNVSKIFIGITPKFSEIHGKKYDGNTILLELKKNNYAIICGTGINNFTLKNDKIIKFYSILGTRIDGPYPFAIGEKNYYFFNYPQGYLEKNLFPKVKKESDLKKVIEFAEDIDPFMYDLKTHKLKNKKITYEEFKNIQNKSLDEISLSTLQTLAKMYDISYAGKSKKEIAKIIYNLRGIEFSKKGNKKETIKKEIKKESKKIKIKSDYPMMIVYLYIEKDEDNNFFTSSEYIPKYSKELKNLYKNTNFKYMDEDIGEFDVRYTLYGVKNIEKIKKILNSTKKLSYKSHTINIKNINIYVYENEKDFEDKFLKNEMKEINNQKNKKKGLFGLFF